MVHLVSFQKQRYHGRAARLLLNRRRHRQRQGAGSGRAVLRSACVYQRATAGGSERRYAGRQSLAVNDSMSQRRVSANAAQGDSVE
jgi:hypothetical protein